ncbi:MAG: winged helix-turn-helix transcriptional regulator [Nitrososphaerales archaeon]
MPLISRIDKMILKEILSPNENKSSTSMCKKLGIPLTTIQRRRKRLEKEFLDNEYTLLLEKFGWRRVDFFISTTDGKTDALANDLLSLNQVTAVGKSIGEHTIDLRVETIVENNYELLDILEKLKAMDGIRDVVWSEIVKTVGNKMSVPSDIIDRL